MGNTFSKIDKLKKDKQIEQVFASKHRFMQYPIKVNWDFAEHDSTVKTLIGCAKRSTRLAVNRNRIKRLMREAYRLNNAELKKVCKQNNVKIIVSLVHIGNEIPNFEYINNKVIKLLSKIEKQVENNIKT